MTPVSIDCPHCGTKKQTFHPLHGHDFAPSGYKHDRFPTPWRALSGKCAICWNPILVVLRILSQRPDGPSVATAVSADKNFIVEAIYPTAQQQKRIRFLPENVSKRFDQAEATFELKSAPNLAVTGYRSCLELGIKHIDPNLKGSLAARTKALVIGGKLPSALAEWIDEVRGAGNDAIHDEDEFSQKDADAIREFCAIVLRSLFEIPGEIAERRARSIGASTATP